MVHSGLGTNFTHYSEVSIVDFEQVIACWGTLYNLLSHCMKAKKRILCGDIFEANKYILKSTKETLDKGVRYDQI